MTGTDFTMPASGKGEDPRALREARRSAARKLGFFIHAGVYLMVNLLLAGLAAYGRQRAGWPQLPLLGWGFGLLIHGIVALGPIDRLRRQLVERELARIRDGR